MCRWIKQPISMRTCNGLIAAVLTAVMIPPLVSSQPSSGELARARALVDNGEIQDAESAVRAFLKQAPNSADGHYLLSYVLFRQQRATDSLAEASAGAKSRAPKADELKIIASDYVLLGAFTDAEKWFRQVTELTPDDGSAWYLLGRTQYNESSFRAAIGSFEHCLSLQARHVEAENNIGLAYRELGENEQAKAAFNTAITWQGDHPRDAQPFLNLGVLLLEEQKVEQAGTYLQSAEDLSPQNATVHENLGEMFLKTNKLPEARAEFEKAVELAPESSPLHFKLGRVYKRLGQNDKAQEQFGLCTRLNGTHSSEKTPNPMTASEPQN